MKEITLAEFCDLCGQQAAADLMGCTIGNISHKLKRLKRRQDAGENVQVWVRVKEQKTQSTELVGVDWHEVKRGN